MRKSILAAISTVLIVGGISRGSIVGHSLQNDGNTSITQNGWGNSGGDNYWLDAAGNQYAGGNLNGSFTTNTAVDPTVIINNLVNNDTTFAWQGYTVDVSMNAPFVLSAASVYTPSDWSVTTVQPILDPSSGLYVGHEAFNAGTPIAISGTLGFQFNMAFSGLTSYSFTETLTPYATSVPEPVALPALLLGAVSLIGRRRRLSV